MAPENSALEKRQESTKRPCTFGSRRPARAGRLLHYRWLAPAVFLLRSLSEDLKISTPPCQKLNFGKPGKASEKMDIITQFYTDPRMLRADMWGRICTSYAPAQMVCRNQIP